MSNLYRGPSKDASYQVLIHLARLTIKYSSYCFLASELSIEKKIKYSKQAAYSQSMGFAINISHAQ
jgi:hypothetical protein